MKDTKNKNSETKPHPISWNVWNTGYGEVLLVGMSDGTARTSLDGKVWVKRVLPPEAY